MNPHELLILPHLGLGDALICNALFRAVSRDRPQAVVLCKPHNLTTVAWMLRDCVNVDTFGVKDDEEAKSAAESARGAGFDVLGLGCWGALSTGGGRAFDVARWDVSFYEQAGVDAQQRWNGFTVSRQPSRELDVPPGEYALVHEDKGRGYLLDPKRLPKLPRVDVDPARTSNLFDYWGLIENATELHLMESSPAILADSLPLLRARRRVIHHYARASVAPRYQGEWEHFT